MRLVLWFRNESAIPIYTWEKSTTITIWGCTSFGYILDKSPYKKKSEKTLFEKILCSLHCNPHPQLILDVCRLIWISSPSQHLKISISQHPNISISVTWLTLITRFILWKSSISWFVNTTIPVCHFVIIKQQSGKSEIFGTLLHWLLPSPSRLKIKLLSSCKMQKN